MDEPTTESFRLQHRKSLEQNRPDLLAELRSSGDLPQHLQKVGVEAKEMYDRLVRDALGQPGGRWTEGQARQMAMETVLQEIVLVPDAETSKAMRDGYVD